MTVAAAPWPPADPLVAPSILAADFSRLGAQVDEVIAAGAKIIHVDVMDGHFVPPISMGPIVVDALAPRCKERGVHIDVHLMIESPDRQIPDFARAGADSITVHAEATPHLHYAAHAIREAGCKAGVAICPSTPVQVLGELADELDIALCMTVNPGWGGQKFIPMTLGKVERLRALCGDQATIEVDGGVDAQTAGPCRRAGAGLFVAGSAVFAAAEPGSAYAEIVAAIRAE